MLRRGSLLLLLALWSCRLPIISGSGPAAGAPDIAGTSCASAPSGGCGAISGPGARSDGPHNTLVKRCTQWDTWSTCPNIYTRKSETQTPRVHEKPPSPLKRTKGLQTRKKSKGRASPKTEICSLSCINRTLRSGLERCGSDLLRVEALRFKLGGRGLGFWVESLGIIGIGVQRLQT